MSPLDFRALLLQAIADISEHGYESPEQIENWLLRLREAAGREVGSLEQIDADMRRALGAIYDRLIDRDGIKRYAPDVPRYTLAMVRPQLRAELDRRILASADLIKLNRAEAVDKTVQRFAGWATSIPPGGASEESRREVRASVLKPIKNFEYHRRFVATDQGHKLINNVANIVAVDNGAIAGEWHSHWRRPGYQFRREHKERDQKVYAIRGSWAVEEGLINKGAGYLDDMTAPGQEPNCTCFVRYIMSPRRVPEDMVTEKGREWLARAQQQRAAE